MIRKYKDGLYGRPFFCDTVLAATAMYGVSEERAFEFVREYLLFAR